MSQKQGSENSFRVLKNLSSFGLYKFFCKDTENKIEDQKKKEREREMESNGGGGEVRRVNLVYFLSRSGHVDHPHLLRVHHLSRNGVFLRG